ncbi:MAG TPA: hypothetical protein VG755_44755 [Nannocystaceae bacterium]|nr:hypothetical protein [Nannocystaceae bacterium]
MDRRLLAALTCVLACNFDSGGAADGSSEGSGGTGSETTTTASTSSPTTTTGNTSASTSATTNGTDDVTGEPTSSVDGSSSSVDGSSSASTTTDGEASSSTGPGEPVEHHVEHGTQSACDDPLWCAYNGDIYTPAGGPIEGVECFIAPVDPPYELIAMHYSVAALHTDVEQFELRIYAWEGDVPTDLLSSVTLNSSFASPMEHDYDFDDAIAIDTIGFCVGFATTEPGLASAVGMAVDADSALPDVSFIRMDGMCSIADWEDVIDSGLMPLGNWCMDATIRTIP